jgi:serine/threonine protein phosphatase PrpC
MSNSMANASPMTSGTYKQNYNTIDQQDLDASRQERLPLH